MTNKQIKQTFRECGIQVSADSLKMIQRELKVYVDKMAVRCVKGNIKRLSPQLFWVALGRLSCRK